jgi:Spy/CpxP family protein refolding chaperone
MSHNTSPARRLFLGVAFAATFAAGGLVLPTAASAMQDAMANEMMDGHMGGHMGMAGHGHMHAMMHAHIAHMLEVAGATPEQKAKIHQIMMGAMQSLGPPHHKLAGTHQELHAILTAPTIDRAALERLRAERMADADQASRVVVQALADAAEVLTPEQRAKLATAMAEHQHAHPNQP